MFGNKIREIGLTVAFSAMGFVAVMLLKLAIDVEISKTVKALTALAVNAAVILWIFRKYIKLPFGAVSLKEFFTRLGVCHSQTFKYILLGLVLALFSVGGMIAGSYLTGLYKPDFSQITLSQGLFSLNPGIMEEIMFRGVMMILLLRMTRSMGKAVLIQIIIFAAAHMYSFSAVALTDLFSVGLMAAVFTYSAFKTRSLIPGIIFHILHDTFVYFAQPAEDALTSYGQNMIFFGGLWTALVFCALIIKIASEKMNVKNSLDIFSPENYMN